MTAVPPELTTLRDFLRWATSRFSAAGLSFGHGTQNAFDEAAWLLLHTLRLPPDRLELFLDATLTQEERGTVAAIIDRRIGERLPAAYLTGEAWLRDLRFRVDPRVIVPRSHIAGLLLDEALAPWIGEAEAIASALDLCTGSGCLAIVMARAFPLARIDAADLSADALEVARENVADYALGARIELVRSDLFDGLAGRRYDLIVSNPPYVTGETMRRLPPEYRHEPAQALAAGEDGLDAVRAILTKARAHLKPEGLLVVEVGNNRGGVEKVFPALPFTWLEAESGEETVFVLQQDQLPR